MGDEKNFVISIGGKDVYVRTESLDIHKLNYFGKNPRVCSIVGRSDSKEGKERQEFIGKVMENHENVKSLVPRIKHGGGLQTPIFVVFDTKEVIEGNSRLAAYRKLYEETNEQKWKNIPCHVVDSLTLPQILAFLNEEHGQGKGKRNWSPYENAHSFFDLHFVDGISMEDLSEYNNIPKSQVSKYIDIIKIMKENDDSNEKNFSYYESIRTGKAIYSEFSNNSNFKDYIFSNIKDGDFNEAKAMRDNLPNIIPKKKILNKLISGSMDFDEASDICRPPNAKKIINIALEKLKRFSKAEVDKMGKNDINASALQLKKLKREVERIDNLLNENGA